jgi:CheY-like chemotaxis protein
MLVSRGHEVSIAVNGIECLKALDAAYESGSPFDAVLLDEFMPLMSGHETADAIRLKGFHVPIYSLTSQLKDSPLDDYRDYGIDAVMLKPLNLNELGEYMRLQDRWRRGSTGSIPIRPGTLMDGGIDEGVEDNGSV